ncbi:hypothetical protein Tco_0302739 [Tanacetum coccineum]
MISIHDVTPRVFALAGCDIEVDNFVNLSIFIDSDFAVTSAMINKGSPEGCALLGMRFCVLYNVRYHTYRVLPLMSTDSFTNSIVVGSMSERKRFYCLKKMVTSKKQRIVNAANVLFVLGLVSEEQYVKKQLLLLVVKAVSYYCLGLKSLILLHDINTTIEFKQLILLGFNKVNIASYVKTVWVKGRGLSNDTENQVILIFKLEQLSFTDLDISSNEGLLSLKGVTLLCSVSHIVKDFVKRLRSTLGEEGCYDPSLHFLQEDCILDDLTKRGRSYKGDDYNLKLQGIAWLYDVKFLRALFCFVIII